MPSTACSCIGRFAEGRRWVVAVLDPTCHYHTPPTQETRVSKIQPYLKALVAFVAPGAVVIGSAVTDASAGGTAITGGEWVTAAVACIVTAAGVYAVPNRRSQA